MALAIHILKCLCLVNKSFLRTRLDTPSTQFGQVTVTDPLTNTPSIRTLHPPGV